MIHSHDITPAAAHAPGPSDCDGRKTFYATPDESDEIRMIEVRANVTEMGWDTVAFIEVIWPGAVTNARRICAAVNACEAIETGALERGIVAQQRQALAWLTTAAEDLDAAMDGATDQFDDERAVLAAACCQAQATLAGSEFDIHVLLAHRGQIALLWSVEDVQDVRPDLTNREAWEVLKHVKDHHDAAHGVTWDTLEWTAQALFGPAPEPVEA